MNTETIDDAVRNSIDSAIARNIPGLPRLELDLDLEAGPTPRNLVFSHEVACLYHYPALCDEVYRVPLMLIMSPVAPGAVLDLVKGQSLVEYLLTQGHDVYMLDWKNPRRDQSHLDVGEFVLDMVGGCVEAVARDSGVDAVSLVGYCMGGMLAALYATLDPPRLVANLACFATPVNADGMPLYKQWMSSPSFDVDRLVDQLGNVPGDYLNYSMQALRPLQRTANRLKILNAHDDDAFVAGVLRFERWATAQFDMPGALMRTFTRQFVQENRLVRGDFEIRGQVAALPDIKMPCLHVAAEHDHIIPSAASADLVRLAGSADKQEVVLKGGHVSLVAGSGALFRMWPLLDRWLAERGT